MIIERNGMKKIIALSLCLLMLFTTALADSYTDMMDKAESYYTVGDAEHAIACFHLAQELDSSKADAFYGEAAILFMQEKYTEAEEAVKKALKADPVSTNAWTLKCRIDVAKGDSAAYETDKIYADVCDGDLMPYAAEIAVMYTHAGEYEKAVEYFAATEAELLPEELREMYRKALIATGQRNKAEELGLIRTAERNEKLDAAFAADNLMLKKVEIPDFSIEDFDFPDDMWGAVGMDKPDDPYSSLKESFENAEHTLISLSPTGNSGFWSVGETVVSFYNKKVHIIYPSQTHGVVDVNDNLKTYYKYTIAGSGLLGEEGVVYSTDGRYAAIYNIERSLVSGQYFFDPIIIDLSTGEMILTATYGNRPMKESAGVVTTATFSADGRYFYYTLYGNTTEDRNALYRYDLSNGETELCCSIPYLAYYPHLSETANGSFLIVEDKTITDQGTGIIEISYENGQWITERHAFSMPLKMFYVRRLLYSQNSDYTFLVGDFASGRINAAFMVTKPGEDFMGLNEYHAISREFQEVVDLNEDDYVSSMQRKMNQETMRISGDLIPYASIQKAVLSPDGFYAMVLTRNSSEDAHLYLIELETLQCKEIKGVDTLKIPVGSLAGRYAPIIEWNGDTLIIRTNDGIGTYSFE